MTDLSFDDLIPKKPESADLSFDDLIPQKRSMLRDIGEAVGSGVIRAGAGLVGAPADIVNLGSQGMNYVQNKLVDWTGLGERPQEPKMVPGGSQDVMGLIERNLGELPKPQTGPGKYAETITEFATPGGLMGKAGRLRSVVAGGAGGAASESAGQLAEGTALETPIRVLAGILGTAITGGRRVFRPVPEDTVKRALVGVTDEQLLAAQNLMDDAARMGTSLTGAEAISQATGGNRLASVQRVAEQAEQGADAFAPIMNRRPQANEAVFQSEASRIGSTTAPADIAENVSQAGRAVIQDLRGQRTQAAQPFYEAAQGQAVNPTQGIFDVLSKIDQKIAEVGPASATGRQLSQMQKRINNAKTVGELDTLYKETRDVLDTIPLNPTAPLATTRGVVGPINTEFGEAIAKASPEIGQGRRVYREMTPPVTEARRPDMMGALQKAVPEEGGVPAALARQAKVFFDPQTTSPERIKRASALLQSQPGGEQALRDLARNHLESTFADATKRLTGGPAQWGAAKYASIIAGNAKQAANMRATIESLPEGKEVYAGFRRMLDVFEAQGMRHRPGSMTEFNKQITGELSAGGVGKAVATASPSKLMDFYERFRYGRNASQMADILTRPDSVAYMRQLARAAPQSEAARQIVLNLVNLSREASED